MSIIIRDATDADVPHILGLFNHHVRTTTAIWRDQEVDLNDRAAWFNDRRKYGFPVLIAEDRSEFLGFASYGPFRTGSGYGQTVENSVYVASDVQGKGVATSLMNALMTHATQAGRKVMVAAIGLPNEASVRLHSRLGFVEAGVLKGIGLKFGRQLDLLMMQRQL